MSFPIDTLYLAQANELGAGTLLYSTEMWWLRLDLPSNGGGFVPKVIGLTGAGAGSITTLTQPVLALNSKFKWDIRVSNPLSSDPEAKPIGSVTVGENGAVGIWGTIQNSQGTFFCSSLDGEEISEVDEVRWGTGLRYTQYEVWLIDRKTGKVVSDEPLFTRKG